MKRKKVSKKNNKNSFKNAFERYFNKRSEHTNKAILKVISNIRFSITLRISLNYMRLFISSWLLIFILYSITAIYFYYSNTDDKDNIIFRQIQLQIRNNTLDKEEMTKICKMQGFDILIFSDKNLIYSSNKHKYYVNKSELIYFDNSLNSLLYLPEYKFNIYEKKYKIVIVHSLGKAIETYKKLLLFILGIDLFRILIMMIKGKKLNKKVLKPIEDMTEIAKRISAKNLSERINVEGTKNELRDLAKTINNMMNRIEISYNHQKQFVSDASHELRTPISVIQGYANLLNRWGKNDKEVLEESVIAIKHEAENMKDLVEKLLFLARHDKKTLKLNKTKFEIKPLLEEMIKETKIIVKSHIIENNIETNATLYGDKQSIKQAIRIFIDNAIKYTPEGGKITISCFIDYNDCIIEITDTGVGISKKDIKRIFDRFYRADPSRTDNKSSHGLGLSIAKLIVLAHNGKIKVRSKIGEGSTFSLIFICNT